MMLVFHLCLMLAPSLFTRILATTDLFSETDAFRFSSFDAQDDFLNEDQMEAFSWDSQADYSNGDPMEAFSWDSQGLPLNWNWKESSPSLTSQDLVSSLGAQDLSPSEDFGEEVSSCPAENNLPWRKLKIRNPACPNVPTGPISVPDLTNLLNSIDVNDLSNNKDDNFENLSETEKLQLACTDRTTSKLLNILVCGLVDPLDALGQSPGFFTIVRNSWMGKFFNFKNLSPRARENMQFRSATCNPVSFGISIVVSTGIQIWYANDILFDEEICTDIVIRRLSKIYCGGLDTTARMWLREPFSYLPVSSHSKTRI